MNFLYYATFTLLVLVAVLLILLILIQKGRGGGLSSAFGGGGGGSAAFGAKTGDVLTWATSCFFGVFILLAVALDLIVNAQHPSIPVTLNVPGSGQNQTNGNQIGGNPTGVTAGSNQSPLPNSAQPAVAAPTTGPATMPAAADAAPSNGLSPSVFQNPLSPMLSPGAQTPVGFTPLLLPTTAPSSLTGFPLGAGAAPATPGTETTPAGITPAGITPGGLLTNPVATPGTPGLLLPGAGLPATSTPPTPTLLPGDDKDPLTGLPRTPAKLPGTDSTLTVPTFTPGDSRLFGPVPTTKP